MQTKEPQDLRSGATWEDEVQSQKPQDLKRGGHEEKEPQRIQVWEKVEAISTTEVVEIKSQIELMGEEIGITQPKVDIEPLVPVQVEIT